jgi:hypothetical protein
MRDCTRRGDLILDLFLGSGTTIMAAERIGRRAYGMEIEPRFIDAAIRRWQAFTRKDAVDAGSGRTFDELAAERDEAAEGPEGGKALEEPATARKGSSGIAVSSSVVPRVRRPKPAKSA